MIVRQRTLPHTCCWVMVLGRISERKRKQFPANGRHSSPRTINIAFPQNSVPNQPIRGGLIDDSLQLIGRRVVEFRLNGPTTVFGVKDHRLYENQSDSVCSFSQGWVVSQSWWFWVVLGGFLHYPIIIIIHFLFHVIDCIPTGTIFPIVHYF